MKDIGYYKLIQVGEALKRLDRAVAHLEASARLAGPIVPLQKENAELSEKLTSLSRDHGALKSAAEHVASRIDTAIGRLASVLDREGA